MTLDKNQQEEWNFRNELRKAPKFIRDKTLSVVSMGAKETKQKRNLPGTFSSSDSEYGSSDASLSILIRSATSFLSKEKIARIKFTKWFLNSTELIDNFIFN